MALRLDELDRVITAYYLFEPTRPDGHPPHQPSLAKQLFPPSDSDVPLVSTWWYLPEQ